MSMVHSRLLELGEVPFPPAPPHGPERTRIYMLPVHTGFEFQRDLWDWQETFNAMVRDIDWRGPMYLMIDRSYCDQGKVHRGGGPHVDGNYCAEQKKLVGHHNLKTEGLILVNDMAETCCAWRGIFNQKLIGKDGDCQHVDLAAMQRVVFEPGRVYIGNENCIHESLPLPAAGIRTILRINIPGYLV